MRMTNPLSTFTSYINSGDIKVIRGIGGVIAEVVATDLGAEFIQSLNVPCTQMNDATKEKFSALYNLGNNYFVTKPGHIVEALGSQAYEALKDAQTISPATSISGKKPHEGNIDTGKDIAKG
jgi:hypothetical protein